MLFARGGLGDTVKVNVTKPAEAAPRPGTVSTGDTAPFFAIKQHTWAQIDELSRNPPYDSQAYKDDRAIVASGLPQCSAESIDSKTNSCWGRDAFLWDGPGTGSIMTPGTFSLWGIPINAASTQGGRFSKVFVPTAYQRQMIEVQMIRESQKAIMGRHGLRLPDQRVLVGEISGPLIGGNSGSLAPAIRAFIANTSHVATMYIGQALVDGVAEKLSVKQVMDLVPDIAIYWINFEYNPVQPTTLEMTSEGGWASWIRRGGYPLSRALLTGQAQFKSNMTLGVVAGPACVCTTSGAIVAPDAGLTKDGFRFSDGNTSQASIAWDMYVSIYQDVNNPLFEISLYWDDKAWITKLGERAADFMGKLGRLLCDVSPVVQQQVSYSVSEKCADVTTGKPCTKGAQNCRCIKPPSYVQADAAVFNAAMSAWCPAWQSQTTAHPQPQPQPQTPPPEIPAWKPPWWMIVGGGVLIGGALFARK